MFVSITWKPFCLLWLMIGCNSVLEWGNENLQNQKEGDRFLKKQCIVSSIYLKQLVLFLLFYKSQETLKTSLSPLFYVCLCVREKFFPMCRWHTREEVVGSSWFGEAGGYKPPNLGVGIWTQIIPKKNLHWVACSVP